MQSENTRAATPYGNQGDGSKQIVALPNAPELPIPAAVHLPTITLVEPQVPPHPTFVPPAIIPSNTRSASAAETPPRLAAEAGIPPSVNDKALLPKASASLTISSALPSPPLSIAPPSIPSSGSMGKGDVATPSLVSIADRPVPISETLVVPHVTHLGVVGSGSGGGRADNGSDSNGSAPSNTASGIASGATVATPSYASGAVSAATSKSIAAQDLPPGVVRIIQPKDGKFDVIVVQGSESGGFDESAGILQGKPIYTAYIAVGAPKDWILQYCLPASGEDSGLQRNSVRLDSGAPLSAPYPTLILKPPIDIPAGKRLYIHGRITSAGRADQLRVVGKPDFTELSGLLRSVANWEFRPAMKDGSATAVDFLLAVPSDLVN